MTRGQARERRRTAWDVFAAIWAVAIIPNALAEVGIEMHGGWLIFRTVLSVAFVVALLVLILAFVRERLASPESTG